MISDQRTAVALLHLSLLTCYLRPHRGRSQRRLVRDAGDVTAAAVAAVKRQSLTVASSLSSE